MGRNNKDIMSTSLSKSLQFVERVPFFLLELKLRSINVLGLFNSLNKYNSSFWNLNLGLSR